MYFCFQAVNRSMLPRIGFNPLFALRWYVHVVVVSFRLVCDG
jgi:hypothetical protein